MTYFKRTPLPAYCETCQRTECPGAHSDDSRLVCTAEKCKECGSVFCMRFSGTKRCHTRPCNICGYTRCLNDQYDTNNFQCMNLHNCQTCGSEYICDLSVITKCEKCRDHNIRYKGFK